MRCPKCNYTSFDYMDRCRSCGEDLVPTKIKLNIYIKPPELDIDDEGFVVGKVKEEKKERLAHGPTPPDVSMDDVLHEEGEKLESFEFDDENG